MDVAEALFELDTRRNMVIFRSRAKETEIMKVKSPGGESLTDEQFPSFVYEKNCPLVPQARI